ncbi:hypothetical protein ACVIJ6_002398 [Bradyrhizobium sp. USDA 4369]
MFLGLPLRYLQRRLRFGDQFLASGPLIFPRCVFPQALDFPLLSLAREFRLDATAESRLFAGCQGHAPQRSDRAGISLIGVCQIAIFLGDADLPAIS